MTWRPNPGIQESFVASSAREAGFGGKAGTGKSIALILDQLRHVDKPTYSGLMLRRTKPELVRSGGLIDRAAPIFTSLGARSWAKGQYWRFPSGALIEIASLDHERDKERYDGAGFARITFDEAHHFTESQYRYMFSRLRHATIPTRMRLGMNPGAKWIRERFAPWIYPRSKAGFSGPYAAVGERLWVALVNGKDCYVDKHYFDPTCAECQREATGCENHRPISRAFFKAPELIRQLQGTGYLANLNQLQLVERMRLKDGDWFVDEGAGMYFRKEWWSARWDRDDNGNEGRGNIVREVPHEEVTRWVRYWDLAATEPDMTNPDPDWTVGSLLGDWTEGRTALEDVVDMRGTPKRVRDMIRNTVLADVARLRPKRGNRLADYTVVVEIDPGQAAKAQRDDFADEFSKLGVSYDFVRPVSGDDKETRAKPASSDAENGNIVIKAAEWNERVLNVLQAFPGGAHDDHVDSLSGAVNWLRAHPVHRRPTNDHHDKPRHERPHMRGGF